MISQPAITERHTQIQKMHTPQISSSILMAAIFSVVQEKSQGFGLWLDGGVIGVTATAPDVRGRAKTERRMYDLSASTTLSLPITLKTSTQIAAPDAQGSLTIFEGNDLGAFLGLLSPRLLFSKGQHTGHPTTGD